MLGGFPTKLLAGYAGTGERQSQDRVLTFFISGPYEKKPKDMQGDNAQRAVEQDRYRGTKRCYLPDQPVTMKKRDILNTL